MRAERIAVIGLGAMGLPIAVNLIKAGFRVTGADINPGARQAFAEAGGLAHDAASSAALEADVVLVMVVNAEQAERVLFESDGAVQKLKPGALVILSTTMAPGATQSIAAKLAKSDILFLDAPVTGGVRGAQAGALVILAAGPDAAYEKGVGILQAVARHIFRVGDRAGQGATAKILNQLLCGVHLAAAAEAVALAERAGIEHKPFYDFILAGSAQSRMFEDRAPQMWNSPNAVKSALDLFVKDLGLVVDLGKSFDAPTHLAALALELFAKASAAGLGAANDSQIVEIYRGRIDRRDEGHL